MSVKFAQCAYEPLQIGWVRILELFSVDETISALNIPIHQAPPLFGQLTHLRLGKGPGYDALSYLCGDPKVTDRILLRDVDGQITELGIAQNLTHALEGLRTQNRSWLLWVDAVCINQNDSNERNVEVQRMHRIYAEATCVHAWIDVDISPTDEAVRRLPNLSPSHATRSRQAQTGFRPLSPVGSAEKSDVYSIGDQAEAWSSLVPLGKHPYWTRVWIQQEIYYAAKLVIHCGSTTISGEDLGEFLRQIDENVGQSRKKGLFPLERNWGYFLNAVEVMATNEPIFYSKRSQNNGRRHRPPRSKKDLYGTLVFVKGFLNASDSRDCIYGILSLVRGSVEGELDIQVNYKLSVAQVYTDAVRSLLNRTHTLCFLTMSDFSNKQQQMNLPSWVPDWSNPAERYPLRHRDHLHSTNPPAKSDHATNFLPSISPCGRILTVTGVHVGTILHLHKDVVVDLEPETEITVMGAMFRQLKDIARQASEVQEAAGYNPEFPRWPKEIEKPDPQRLAILRAITAFGCRGATKYALANLYEVMNQMMDVVEAFLDEDNAIEPMPTRGGAIEFDGRSDDSMEKHVTARLALSSLSRTSKPATLTTVLDGITAMPGYKHDFIDTVELVNTRRQLCISREGLIGVVPNGRAGAAEGAAVNDEFWFLPGCDVPMLLRPEAENYRVVGDAHINDYPFFEGGKIIEDGTIIEEAYASARTTIEESRFREISLI